MRKKKRRKIKTLKPNRWQSLADRLNESHDRRIVEGGIIFTPKKNKKMSLDVYLLNEKDEVVYDNNITHNLNVMADNAGLYQALWRPEELNIEKASELLPFLTKGYSKLLADPDHFRQYNARNGWGKYENLIEFVASYRKACSENRDSIIYVSR